MNGIISFLPQLDALLKRAVARARKLYLAGEDQADHDVELHGLFISEEEVDELVDRTEILGDAEGSAALLDACDDLPSLATFTQTYGLSPFDKAILLIAAAPELDLRYERIYAYLQDDVSRKRPTVDLALSLLSADAAAKLTNRSHFDVTAPLLRSGLLHLVADSSQSEPPLLSHLLKLDESAARLLFGGGGLDSRLAGFATESIPAAPDAPSDMERRLPPFVISMRKNGRPVHLLFVGPELRAKESAARAIAAALNCPLLSVDVADNATWTADAPAVTHVLVREALRTGAVVLLTGLDLAAPDPVRDAALEELFASGAVVILLGEIPGTTSDSPAARCLTINFAASSYEERRAYWQRAITEVGLYVSPGVMDRLASRFTHGPERIDVAVAAARQMLDWQAGNDQRPSPDDSERELMRAAREQSGSELAALTARVQNVYAWSDLVLPSDSLQQLDEICQRVEYAHKVFDTDGFGSKLSGGKGVAVLFAGPSGTGKTMAAEVVAGRLGLDLFRIDLSTVVSKYIGETEKNLERIFNAATRSSSILLFDEGDALFGKRSEVSSAHDRYANTEVSYLLQKMDQYEGITILTTNLRGNLDEAFLRRLTYTVHFPFPSEADRLRLWKQIWPGGLAMDPDLHFEFLAKHFKLSGGSIRNIALAAAFYAAADKARPVRMSDLLQAIRREYEKAGKVLSITEMEAALR